MGDQVSCHCHLCVLLGVMHGSVSPWESAECCGLRYFPLTSVPLGSFVPAPPAVLIFGGKWERVSFVCQWKETRSLNPKVKCVLRVTPVFTSPQHCSTAAALNYGCGTAFFLEQRGVRCSFGIKAWDRAEGIFALHSWLQQWSNSTATSRASPNVGASCAQHLGSPGCEAGPGSAKMLLQGAVSGVCGEHCCAQSQCCLTHPWNWAENSEDKR